MLANSILETLPGLMLLFAADPLAERLGIASVALRFLGAPLLATAFNVRYHARLQRLHRAQARGVVVIDLV